MKDLKPIQSIIFSLLDLSNTLYYIVESDIHQNGYTYTIKWKCGEIIFEDSIHIPFDFETFDEDEENILKEIKNIVERVDKLKEI